MKLSPKVLLWAPTTHHLGAKTFQNAGRQYWILLANKLFQDITERNLSSKIEENWWRILRSFQWRRDKYLFIFKCT